MQKNSRMLSIGAIATVAMLALGQPHGALAQTSKAPTEQSTGTISGSVVDSQGEPIVGASVRIKGVKIGVNTDLDGKFSIKAKPGEVLEISYIGCTTQSLPAKPGMLVTLTDDATQLDELVVVGFGAVKKASLTGSVAVVDSKAFENKGMLSSPMQALQGQVPGVMITRSSSAPGDESWSLNLRGSVSVNSTDPLVIIDGVTATGTSELNSLNPSDIQSINFLKDGAAAIYGSRAAGGVVIVTTKRGEAGKTRVDYSGTATYRHPGLMPHLLDLNQWADGLTEVLTNDGVVSSPWYMYAAMLKKYQGHYINLAESANPWGNSAFTDVKDFVFDADNNWLQALFGDTWSTEHNLAISGGSGKNSYRVSLRYLFDDSVLKYGNNNNSRYNIRINDNYEFTKWASLESIISYNRQEQVAPTNTGSALTESLPQPGLPMTTINGRPYGWGTWGSPVGKLQEGGDNSLTVSSINIAETLRFKIAPWLDLTGQLGYSTSTSDRETVQNAVEFYDYLETEVNNNVSGFTQEQSYYTQTNARTDFYSASGYLGAHRELGKHNISGTLGMQYEFCDYQKFGITIKDIQKGLETINGAGEISKAAGTKNQYSNMSYFGRVNYDFDSRYILEFNGRYDGSSKFKSENRWDFFWGLSGGWRIDQEPFMKGARRWLSQLKLRASYAEVGNQSGIGYYDGVQLYTISSSSGAYVGSDLLSYISINGTLASQDRTWERIKNYNVGLDFGLLNNHFTGTLEAFLKKNDNMLVSVTYPATLGINAPSANRGKFRDWGLEASGNYMMKVGDVEWNIGGNISFARNKLVDYGGTSVLGSGYTSTQQGYPLYSIFGMQFGGKIQNEEMLAAYIDKYYEGNGIGMPKNLRVGDNMFVDQNGDGILDYNDYIYLGNDQPEISFSFNFGAKWNGFDLSVIFQGSGNRFVYRGINNFTVPWRNYYAGFTDAYIGNIWTPETPNAYYAPLTSDSAINSYNYQSSSLTAQNMSYMRLKTVTLGYTVPSRFLAKAHCLTNARVYVSGGDLWEISNVDDGWDPEASRTVSGTTRYPFTRNVTFGLNLSF